MLKNDPESISQSTTYSGVGMRIQGLLSLPEAKWCLNWHESLAAVLMLQSAIIQTVDLQCTGTEPVCANLWRQAV